MTTQSTLPKDEATSTTNTRTPSTSDQKQRDGGAAAVDVVDPLADLTEPERLALAIRFGRIRMCAALTHGHSFESSIFRLPAKCSGCHELVWGPFTRGCTCLTCKLTAHRSCTGMVTMPQCPTKDVFVDFCRSELGLSSSVPSGGEEIVATHKNGGASTGPQQDRVAAAGDLDEWATVEGTADESCRLVENTQSSVVVLPEPPASASQAVRDLGSSFSWSPFGTSNRKRQVPEDNNEHQQQQQPDDLPVATATGPSAEGQEKADAGFMSASLGAGQEKEANNVTTKDLAVAASSTSTIGIREVGKMSVAGGVVGAVLGGPVGAVVGLKLGAFLGAGRWSVQGLWQRIEKDRQEAGAAGLGLPKSADEAAAVAVADEEAIARRPRDVWARIAEQIEGEEQPLIWELDPEQKTLLEQGECDAGEVAMFVVGKVLANENAMLSHLYGALLAEFRSRHRLCDCRRPIRRRSSDTDMVALFPRAGGSRRGIDDNRLYSSAAQDDSTAFFASTPGLEKSFSFVEEAEIVEGEGSETAFGEDGDGYSSSIDASDGRDGVAPNTRAGHTNRARLGVTAPSSTSTSPGATGIPAATRCAVSVATLKDSWRNNSFRLDSWVELEGVGCGSCGGRTASGILQGQFTSSLGKDVEEDESGFGESWATAEMPTCWYEDERRLLASPEVTHSMLHDQRRDAAGGGNERVPAPTNGEGTSGKHMSADETTAHGDRSGMAPVAAGGPSAANSQGNSVVQGLTDHGDKVNHPENGGTATIEIHGAIDEDKGEEEETCDALRDVHGVLRELTRAVLAWCPVLTASDEAAIHAVNCIDQRVFSETYGPVFGHIASGPARERDAALVRRVRREERSRTATGRPSLTAVCKPQALVALRAAGTARTGRDKLFFFVQAVERISEGLPAKATTDTLLWSLCRHLAAATMSAGAVAGRMEENAGVPLPRPHAEVAFIEQFVRDESWLMGKQGYVLTTVDAALHVLLDPSMSDEVFLDPPGTAEEGNGGEGDVGSTRRDDRVL